MADVYLVSMPYAALERPSLALGSLKAALARNDIAASVRHAGLDFAEEIGLPAYQFLATRFPRLLMGEWTFAAAAFPQSAPDPDAFLDSCAGWQVPGAVLRRVRQAAAPFIERLADEILATSPRIVGCSSTFQQHCASLALLQRIRALRPQIVTALGGASCEHVMGEATHDAFPFVDFVFSGEAEETLPLVCKALLGSAGAPPPRLAGVRGPVDRATAAPNDGRAADTETAAPCLGRTVITDLDSLPLPDFDDYFATLAASPLASAIRPGLVIETARGCWWGERRHCTFCGLSDEARTYRTKSPQRVAEEWRTLRSRHGLDRFMATDSIYDSKRLATAFLPRDEERTPPAVFFETPGSLTPAQVEQLSRSGIRWIQPGFESMHDGLLALLRKGTRAWKNVRMLKACLQHGIFVWWNLLAAAPGDEAAWYHEMLGWLPLIAHLQPPAGLWPIRFDRFGVYHDEPDRHGLRLEPVPAYAHIFPSGTKRLCDIAAFFEDRSDSGREREAALAPVLQELQAFVLEWDSRFYGRDEEFVLRRVRPEKPSLFVHHEDGALVVADSRPCAVADRTVLEGLGATVLTACETAPEQSRLHELVVSSVGRASARDVERCLEDLVERRFVLRLGGHVIALPIREPCTALPLPIDNPCGTVLMPRWAPNEEGRGA